MLWPVIRSLKNLIPVNSLNLIWSTCLYHMPRQIREFSFTCPFHNAEIGVGIVPRTRDCQHWSYGRFFEPQFCTVLPYRVMFAFLAQLIVQGFQTLVHHQDVLHNTYRLGTLRVLI